MSDDDALRAQLVELGRQHGEALWPLPLPDHLAGELVSAVADLKNLGDAKGGALSAGLFLQRFVGKGRRWAHLDIAGAAFNAGTPHGYTPAGGTGAAVPTLVALAEALAGEYRRP